MTFPQTDKNNTKMKRHLTILVVLFLVLALPAKNRFVKVDGPNLVKPNGERLLIQGTNLGNWLNPEGYMFGLRKTNSAWMITSWSSS